MKFKQGWIGNNDGRRKDIIVTTKFPNRMSDIMIGGALIVAGVLHLTTAAFKHGSEAYEEAELETLGDLDLLK